MPGLGVLHRAEALSAQQDTRTLEPAAWVPILASSLTVLDMHLISLTFGFFMCKIRIISESASQGFMWIKWVNP